MCIIKRTSKCENNKNCLEVAQIENKIDHLDNNKTDVDSTKEFTKNNKLILKTYQRFKSKRHNIFTEETKKIFLSSDDDKRMQPINLIEMCAYGMNKNLVCKKEKNKCNNIIKQYKNV